MLFVIRPWFLKKKTYLILQKSSTNKSQMYYMYCKIKIVFQDGPTKYGRLKGFILKKQLTNIVKDVSKLVTAYTARISLVFSARCNIYISRLCYDVSVRLSVRL